MRKSKYWDDFKERAAETIRCIKSGTKVPVRRVACFITTRCNFKCQYCNHTNTHETMRQEVFERILEQYGDSAIYHITGGEPSVVPWLYDFINEYGNKFRFHLNSNSFISPPAQSIKRLKVSLDSSDHTYWNKMVGVDGAFERVVRNIKDAAKHTVVSITYTLTAENYKGVLGFADFCNREFDGLYAVFFSIYKGSKEQFAFGEYAAKDFFENIKPELEKSLNCESRFLLNETMDEKRRLLQGARFDQGELNSEPCYLSMSERVFDTSGNKYTCSHLFRDGIKMKAPSKHEKCKYGCNQRLVDFNRYVHGELYGRS